jgi:integrase/recombinase XerD
MLKVAYSYGLRFNKLRHLQTVDFATNLHARRFGNVRCLQGPVRKVPQGITAKPRSVLTVFDGTAGVSLRTGSPTAAEPSTPPTSSPTNAAA